MQSIVVRTALIADAEEIANIYNYEVENSTATFDLVPRTVEEQRAWLMARSGAFTTLVAVDHDSAVVGFAALSAYRDRAAYRATVENSIYIHRNNQRRGIGRTLLSALLEVAEQSGFHTVVARIDSQSDGSLALHKSVGFVEVGIERQVGRKFGRWLDSVIMQKMLNVS